MGNAAIREKVSKQILSAIESGKTLAWRRPWTTSKNAGRPTSLASRKAYSGVNSPLLQIHANRHQLSSKWWATYRQWESLGLPVKKRPDDVPPGEWGATIVFYKPINKKRTDDEGQEIEDRFFMLRTFVIFNADQVEGADVFQNQEPNGPVLPDFGPADEMIAATGADIRHGGERAFYERVGDYIQMPHKQRFNPPGAYYETLLHELAHFSEPRLGWNQEQQGYAMGELVAELTASMLSAELGVPQGESLDNHAAYLKHWMDAMRADSSFIFKASTQASKVADFLLSHVQQQAVTSEPAFVV